MKLQIPLWLLGGAILDVWCWSIQAQFNTSRLSSDATLSPHGLPMAPVPVSALFVPPSDMIHVEFFTNTVPLIVRVEVSSNVWRRTVWWQNGKAQTNESLMASNMISAVTNSVL